MPGYRAHVSFGIILYVITLITVATFLVFSPPFFTAIEWFLCTIAGSLFPDIDTKSKGQLIFYKVISFLLLFLLWKQKMIAFIWLSLIAFVPLMVHHRGLFHKLWFVLLLPFIVALLLATYAGCYQTHVVINGLFFSLGAVSHIVLDRGVSWFKRPKF